MKTTKIETALNKVLKPKNVAKEDKATKSTEVIKMTNEILEISNKRMITEDGRELLL